MKRTITIQAGAVRITATIDTDALTRGEIEKVRDALGDKLMQAAAELPFRTGGPLCRMTVKGAR